MVAERMPQLSSLGPSSFEVNSLNLRALSRLSKHRESGARRRVRSRNASLSAAQPELTYATDHGSYRVSAGSFFQVNRHLIDELVEIVTHGRSGQVALDLYAGVGLFSSAMARNFHHIVAVESSQNSHSDLQYNSPANVKAVRATVDQYLARKPDKFCPELVVVDPPRSGLGEKVAGTLSKIGSPRITYVSCDPATLARDLKLFLTAGYRLDEVHLVDLFPQTFHLESVVQLVR